MTMHPVSKQLLRMIPILIGVLAVVGPRTVAAQQAVDRVAATATPAPESVPAPQIAPDEQLSGPRLRPLIATFSAAPAESDSAGTASSRAFADGGGRHTIVLSTLSLVLIVVLIVLLI